MPKRTIRALPYSNSDGLKGRQFTGKRATLACRHCGSISIAAAHKLANLKNNPNGFFFCDQECANEYKRWHNRTEDYRAIMYRPSSNKPDGPDRSVFAKAVLQKGWKVCLWCGSAHKGKGCGKRSCQLERARIHANRIYDATRENRVGLCNWCKKGFKYRVRVCSKDRLYCSSNCARKDAKHRRDQRQLNGDRGLNWIYVLGRDKTCRYCGVACVAPTGMNLPNEATLDHIRPIAKGGKHNKENSQLLCRQCNSIKSDQWLDSGQLLLPIT